ncbi:hypothetical protein [Streptomyces sp. NPDC048385]|uniref:hypothetical protein n=1 Tax=unclassified Streptomyces TaxID=2593676 RepID=UPI0034315D2C
MVEHVVAPPFPHVFRHGAPTIAGQLKTAVSPSLAPLSLPCPAKRRIPENSRLADRLLAALPAPTAAGERFWSDLWRSSGTAYLLPVNIKDPVLRSLAGEGTALARQILSAVDEMTPPQRFAAGEVIGQALVESDHLPDLKTQVIGELWLRDLELTAWRVLHADRRSDDPAGRKAFLDAWTSV